MQTLSLNHVHKSFGKVQAVKNLTLSIEEGTIFGLLGPNGAGKTTTIRMIMQIIMPDSGDIRLFEQPNSPELLEKVGYLPEERGLYGKMKVGEQILFFAELKNIAGREAEKRARQWLGRFQMTDVWDKKLEELSKGNQQKIQFIVSILHEPRLVILDEPFSGLDPVNAQLIKDIMLEMKEAGCSIIFSTHQMDQVERLCDAICLIDKGEAVLQGDLREIKRRFGRDTVILEYDGENNFFENLDYVKKVNDYGNYVEIHLTDGKRAQDLLKSALQRVQVLKFELVEPTLNEIFIRTVTQE
ncbi:MAG: ATP-binding cassette domain-containing protein [candidate division KSB1 bacterium]|nr:ATP-binding cassette domain-containing protein [candidate division KSB1 bacterium]